MASAVSNLLGNSTPANATGAGTVTSPAPSEQMFLQLLVSQLQNQDPLNPADSTQFVSQLAQFSELENVIGIRTDIETAMGNNAGAGTPTGTTPGATTNPNSSTPATTN